MTHFSPREIVSELDRFIIGQVDAKRRIVEVAGPILLVDDTATANAQ